MASPLLQIPRPEADRPSWVRVGIVAVIGFAIGIAWPRIAGIRLGPSAPSEVASAVAAELPSSMAAAPFTALSAVNAVVSSPPVAAPVASVSPPTILVSRGNVLSCRNDEGESLKGKDCGRVSGFDSIAQSRIKRIVASPAAQDNEGKLSVLLTLDFTSGKITYVDVGKSSTVKNPEAFKSLLATQFQGVSLGTLDHDQPRVTMTYSATISPGNGSNHAQVVASASGSDSPAAAHPVAQNNDIAAEDGTATVSWDVAVVRDQPHTGAVVARLPRGTKVKLGDAQGGWYRIKFGNGFTEDGWLYRDALRK